MTDNLWVPRTSLAKAALMVLVLVLAGCAGQPAGGAPPAATVAAPVAATQAPVATSGNTPVRTPRPTAIPVGNATIEITGMITHTTISPRRFVRVLTTDSPLEVTVHFPGSLDGRQVDTKITQPASVFWTIQTGGPSDADTVNFTLTGTEPGIFTVQVLAEGYAPVIFGVQASLPPTPGAGTPQSAMPGAEPTSAGTTAAGTTAAGTTVAGTTAAGTTAAGTTAAGTPTAGATVAPTTTVTIVGTSVPSVSGPIVGSAVPGSGSLTTATPPGGPPGSRAVTLADNNGTVTMHVGERFLLDLGEGYDWQVTIEDPTIVSRVPNILTIKGSQGLYEGHKPGRTTLSATGDPTCSQAQPPCKMPSRRFQVQIIVQ
jgi:hypothetical protein